MPVYRRPYGIALDTESFVPVWLRDRTTGLFAQPTLADTGVAATGTLTLTADAGNNETVTIGTTVYTFKTALTPAAYEVLISGTASGTIDNLIAAINRAAGEGTTYGAGTVRHPDVTAAAGAGDTMDLTGPKSSDGNNIATTETMANGSWGAANLASGADSDLMIRRDANREESAYSQWSLPTGSHSGRLTLTAAQLKAAQVAVRVEDKSGTDFIDASAVIETTGHHLAMHPEGVIYAGYCTAIAAGSLTLAAASGFDPGFPANTSLRGCRVVVRQSDVAADGGAVGWVAITGFDGSASGVVTLGVNWNRTPTGTASSIEVAFYSENDGLSTQVKTDIANNALAKVLSAPSAAPVLDTDTAAAFLAWLAHYRGGLAKKDMDEVTGVERVYNKAGSSSIATATHTKSANMTTVNKLT